MCSSPISMVRPPKSRMARFGGLAVIAQTVTPISKAVESVSFDLVSHIADMITHQLQHASPQVVSLGPDVLR